MSMQYLKSIEYHLNKVMNIACDLDNCNSDTLNKVISTYRKVRLSRLLDHEKFVAIGGTQGAGKSTLLSTIYGLEDWLKLNNGRGEQVPVFIYEKEGIEKPEAIKVVFNTDSKIESEKACDKDEFQKIITQWDYNELPEERTFYVKLFVPPVFDIPFGWALLPGYEIETQKNHAWQQLMRYVMTHALGVIIVTSEERLAHDQANIINDLKDSLELRNPVIAITRADTYRDDKAKLEDLTNRAKEVYQVSDKEIVFTGLDFENWRDDFEEVVVPILSQDASVVQDKLHSLTAVIEDEIDDIITEFNILTIDADISKGRQNEQIDNMMEKFDSSVSRYKRELVKQLSEQTSSLANRAIERAMSEYDQEEVGFTNNLKLGVKKITFNSSKVEDARKQRVRKHFNSDNLMKSNLLAINQTAQNQLNFEISNNYQEGNLLCYENNKVEPYDDSQVDESFQKSVQKGLNTLLKKNELVQSSNEGNSIENAMSALPALAMEYSRIVQAAYLKGSNENLKSKLQNKDLGINDIQDLIRSMASETQMASSNIKAIVGTIGSLVGVDLIDGKLDGRIDLFNDTDAKSDSNSASAAQAAAVIGMRIAGLAMAVGAVAFTAYQASQTVAMSDRNNKEFIELYARDLARNNNGHVISEYDEHMQKLSEYLRSNLEQMYGIRSTDSQHQMMVALNSLKKSRKELRKLLKNEQLNMV